MVSSQGRNLTLVILGGLVFGTAAWGVDIFGVPLTVLLLQSNSLVYQGWIFQLLTSLVVAPPNQLGLLDALFNALAVLWLDRLLSGAFEAKEYYAIFIFTGLGGNLLSLLEGPNLISFGASGGIFGLLAAAVAANYADERRVNPWLLISFLLIFVVSSFISANVNWVAHLGGTLAGLAMGYYLGGKLSQRSL